MHVCRLAFLKEFDARKMRPIRCMVDFTGFVQDIACFGPAQTWTVCPVLLNGFLASGRWRGLPLPPWTVCPTGGYVPSSWTSFWPAAGGVACPRPRPVAPAPAPRTALRWGPWANYSISARGECFVHCDAYMFRLQFLTTILLPNLCLRTCWSGSNLKC